MRKCSGREVKVAVLALGLIAAVGFVAQAFDSPRNSATTAVEVQKKPAKGKVKAGPALKALLSKAGVESLDQVRAPKAVAASAFKPPMNKDGDSLNFECVSIPACGYGFSFSLEQAKSSACEFCVHLYGPQCRYDCYAWFKGHRQYQVEQGPCTK